MKEVVGGVFVRFSCATSAAPYEKNIFILFLLTRSVVNSQNCS
jgi:hypothetical protein